MNSDRDFVIEDMLSEEIVCNIDIEEIDIAKLPLIEGETNEQYR